MSNEQCRCAPLEFLRLQSWFSPVFPTGAYSYSHGLEWAVEPEHIYDRKSLVDWLEADLCYGSGRNEAIFFSEAWRSTMHDDRAKLFEIAELAACPCRKSHPAFKSLHLELRSRVRCSLLHRFHLWLLATHHLCLSAPGSINSSALCLSRGSHW